MSVPDYQSLMLPALKALADGVEAPVSELRARIATAEGLTPEDLSERTANGTSVIAYRVHFALLGIERAGLVERVSRGVYRLAADGDALLAREPARVDDKVLRTYPAFVEWRNRVRKRKQSKGQPSQSDSASQSDESEETPEETLDRAAEDLRALRGPCREAGQPLGLHRPVLAGRANRRTEERRA